MERDSAEWISLAEDNLATAKILYHNERFRDAAYYCQQIAEKSLKAVQIAKLKRFDKVHDLQVLADSIKAPKSIIECSKKLTRYYISTRYPIQEESEITENDAEEAVSDAEEVLEWAKSSLK